MLDDELKTSVNEVEMYWDNVRVKIWQDGATDFDDDNQPIIDIKQPLTKTFLVTGNPGSTIVMELIFRGDKNFYSKRDIPVELTP
jgi:hypothetical protein